MGLGAMIAAGIGAAANAIKNKNNTASGSSGSTSKSTGGGSYTPSGSNTDAGLSAADAAKMQVYKDAYNKAQAAGDTAGMEKAHADAEALRGGYGYSGGKDGSEYIAKAAGGTTAGTGSGNTAGGAVSLPAMGMIGAGLGAAMGAIKGLNGSGGASASAGSGSLTLPNYGTLSAEDVQSLLNRAQQNSQNWYGATPEQQKLMHGENNMIYGLLGYSYDDKTGEWSRTGMADAVEGMAVRNDEQKRAQEYLTQQQQQAEEANRIATQQAIDALEGHKYDIRKSGQELNAAAQEAYMTAMNPNGGMAEQLAAQGLLPSGLTETSMISSGNAYQNALNNNATLVTEQLAEIERAIVQAQQNGDLAAANLLADYYQQASQLAQANAQSILSFGQWLGSYRQAADQQAFENNLTLQELDMKRRQVEQALQQGEIDRQTAERQLAYLDEQIRSLQMDNRYKGAQMSAMGY